MNKKAFQTTKLNEVRQKQRRCFLIFPIIMAVLLLWGGAASISELNRNNLVPGLICVVLITFFCSVILGIVPFYMRYVKLQGQKKQLLENSSFITMNNLDYYRDKLTGITPGAISMLEDLQLEPDKDLTACILRYEMLGMIRQTAAGYEKGAGRTNRNANLHESDWYLIEHLVIGDWKQEPVFHTWEQMTVSEVKKAGWLTERFLQPKEAERTRKRQGRIALIWILALLSFCMLVTMGSIKQILQEHMSQEQFEQIPKAVFVVGEVYQEVLDDLGTGDSFGTYSEYLFEAPARLWKLTLVTGIDCVFLLLFLFPVLYMKFGQGRTQEYSPYKRTVAGDLYAEYIYGMKNFIHDYSCLSEAEKDSLVLWDDYLIYAVILEENKKIVEEMMQRRNGA